MTKISLYDKRYNYENDQGKSVNVWYWYSNVSVRVVYKMQMVCFHLSEK